MMDAVQRVMARLTSDENEGLNQSALSCGVITMVTAGSAHAPPSVGIAATVEARALDVDPKYVIEKRRMATRTSALNSKPLFQTLVQPGGVFLGFLLPGNP